MFLSANLTICRVPLRFQVLQTPVLDEPGAKRVASLMHRPELDFWSDPRVGSQCQIMAGPQHVAELHRALEMMGLEPSVLVPDVGV